MQIPKAKPLTRWQKFAQEKGIVKKKRSVMEYDELREEYRPRFALLLLLLRWAGANVVVAGMARIG